jgi:hypothetical protein
LGAALATAAHAAPDVAADTLNRKAEACLRAQAQGAAEVTKTPGDAVTFLIDGLCASDIQHFENYKRNSAMLENWRATPVRPTIPVGGSSKPMSAYEQSLVEDAARTQKQLVDVSVDTATGELHTPAGFKPPSEASSILLSTLSWGFLPPAHFKQVAAEAVLAALQAGRH